MSKKPSPAKLAVRPSIPWPRLTIRDQVVRLHEAVHHQGELVLCACDDQWYSAQEWAEHRDRALLAAGESRLHGAG